MTYLVHQLDARVEPIEIYLPGDEWGYSFRDNVNKPGQLSCHASATAIDWNATKHPNRIEFTFTREQVREIHKLLDELEGVVRWLEGYDEMHFEIRGSAADVKRVADKIRAMSKPKPPTPTPDPDQGEDDMTVTYAWFKDTAVSPDPHLYAMNGQLATVTSADAYDAMDALAKLLSGGKVGAPKWNTRTSPFMAGSAWFINTGFLDGPLKGR
jgi:hypothetical protein